MSPRIGELFAGYGGLGMGVQAVLGGEIAWFSEFDPAPSKILAHHWPDVPNHGDITKIDWSSVEPVDILTGGFPCQDVSLAGARAGFTETSRSGLWSEFARAIAALKPEMVVIENVRGLLSASAAGSVEPDPWGVGDGTTRPVVNALGAVLGDLASLGYDAEWCGVRAAEAGAPHGRFRVFIVAHPAGRNHFLGYGGSCERRWPGEAQQARLGGSTLANANSLGHERPGSAWVGRDGSSHHCSVATYAAGVSGRVEDGDCEAFANLGCISSERWRETGDMVGAKTHRETDSEERQRDGDAVDDSGSTDWAEFEPAIRRWESVMDRLAPRPVEGPTKNGARRLSARFEEWMMGLADGHVTSPEIGLSWNEQVKALGNGVVPQQAALAIRTLLKSEAVSA